jgi:uncharacterized membrane protein
MIIWAIISEILNSITAIFRKKSLNFNAPKELFKFFAYSPVFLITLWIFLAWKLNIVHLNFTNFIIIFSIVIIWLWYGIVEQTVYKRNKLSSILPYLNISKIIVIVFWYIIFHDTSQITLICAILATLTISIFSIDFKNFTIPRDIKILFLLQTVYGIITLVTIYLLKQIGNVSYFFYTYLIWIIFIGLVVLYKWQFKLIPKLPKKFYIYRLSASHLWWISYLISLLIIQNLWATLGMLVSYIWLAVTLLFSYLFLWEKIEKKDTILAIIVSFFIGIWYIYK